MNRQSTVPWYRRLSVRWALIVAIILLAWDNLSSPIYEWVIQALGYDLDAVFEPWVITDEQRAEELARQGLRMEQIARIFGDPRMLAEPGPLARLFEPEDEALVLINPAGVVTFASPSLPFQISDPWHAPLESHTDVSLGDERFAHVLYEPLPANAGHVALLALLSDGGFFCAQRGEMIQPDGTVSDELVLASEEAFDEGYTEFFAGEYRADRLISTGITVIVALLLGALSSLWVTRRLRRISAVASRTPEARTAVPGPFDASGSDEIAVLARTMNTMRERVNELVHNLEQQDTKRKEWVAQVSHDLRTPLTALVACLGRAESILPRLEPEPIRKEMTELLAVANLDIERVNVLADDLLEIARLDAGHALNLEPVPPGELARQAVRGLSPLAQTRNIDLDLEIGTNLPILSADGRRLIRALENLLRNAIDHATAKVRLRVWTAEDHLRFEVQDDGPGLPETNGEVALDQLRAELSRADSAGLGLVVARKVTAAHSGRFGASNRPAGGASVWFELPLP